MPKLNTLRTVALTASLLVLPISSLGPIQFGVDPAFAGNGNGNGGGNGGGNGSGNGGGNASSGGQRESVAPGNSNKPGQMRVERANDKGPKSNFKSLKEQLFGKPAKTTIASAPVKKVKSETKVASKSLKQRKESQVAAVGDVKKTKSPKGSLASKLGALNAAHASAQAFANASPNSRVGRIRAYYEENAAAIKATEAAAASSAELEKAQLAYDEAVKLQAAVDKANANITELNGKLAVAEETLKGLLPTDPGYAEAAQAVEDLKGEIEGANTALTTAKENLGDVDVKALEESVATAEAAAKKAAEAADLAEADALKALEAAANKPVTDEVRDALDKMLEGKIILEETASVEDPTTEPILIGDM